MAKERGQSAPPSMFKPFFQIIFILHPEKWFLPLLKKYPLWFHLRPELPVHLLPHPLLNLHLLFLQDPPLLQIYPLRQSFPLLLHLLLHRIYLHWTYLQAHFQTYPQPLPLSSVSGSSAGITVSVSFFLLAVFLLIFFHF